MPKQLGLKPQKPADSETATEPTARNATPDSTVSNSLCDLCTKDLPDFELILKSPVSQQMTNKFRNGFPRTLPLRPKDISCFLCRALCLRWKNQIKDESKTSVDYTICVGTFCKDFNELAPYRHSEQYLKRLDFYCLYIAPTEYVEGSDQWKYDQWKDDPVKICLALDESECEIPVSEVIHSESTEPENAFPRSHSVATRDLESRSDASSRYAACYVEPGTPNYSLVSFWIETCTNYHGSSCAKSHNAIRQEEPHPPAAKRQKVSDDGHRRKEIRLIDCNQRTIVGGTTAQRYVTLSYVWGNCAMAPRPSQRLDEDARLPDSLPRTIEDAIEVTLRLGYTYLWVDQYCIIQNDDNHHKWDQLKSMHLIYACSALTIIDAMGKDANLGLAGVSSVPRSPQIRLRLSSDLKVVEVLPRPERALAHSKWATRGWTFQEGLLASRRLAFTEHEMYFECSCFAASESIHRPSYKTSYPLGTRLGYFASQCTYSPFGEYEHGRTNQDKLLQKFMKNLSSYLARDLTYPSDLIVAFKGYVESIYPSGSVHGLPLRCQGNDHIFSNLPSGYVIGNDAEDLTDIRMAMSELDRALTVALTRSLAWWPGDRGKLGGRDEDHIPRRPEFPSFTWAGWFARVPRFCEHGIDSWVRFPDMDWTDLVEGEPAAITVEAFTSAVKLKIQDGTIGFNYLESLETVDPAEKVRSSDWALLSGVLDPAGAPPRTKRLEAAEVQSFIIVDPTAFDPPFSMISDERIVEFLILYRTNQDLGYLSGSRTGAKVVGLLFKRHGVADIERIGYLELRFPHDNIDALKERLEAPLIREVLKLR